jgi:hypothetical protein
MEENSKEGKILHSYEELSTELIDFVLKATFHSWNRAYLETKKSLYSLLQPILLVLVAYPRCDPIPSLNVS